MPPGDPCGGGGEENGVMGPNAVASLLNGMERDDRRENAEKKKAMFRNKVQLGLGLVKSLGPAGPAKVRNKCYMLNVSSS